MQSVPNTLNTIKLGPSLCNNLSNFGLWTAFRVLEGSHTEDVTVSIIGATIVGDATYSVRKGRYTTDGTKFTFSANITWSGHTGTGFGRIRGLQLPANITEDGTTVVVSAFGGSFAAGGNVIAQGCR